MTRDRSCRLGRGPTTLLLALAILPHLPLLRIGFLHDDLFHYLHGFLFDGVGATLLERWVPRPGEEFYRPLTDTTFGINYLLGGVHPVGYRLVDLLLHGAATWLAARVVLALTGRRAASVVVGAILAVHPLAARALCWTSDRYVVLATLFTLASVWLYVRWREQGGRARWLTALVCQALGLLSKESAAAIPVALLVVEIFCRPGDRLCRDPDPGARSTSPQRAGRDRAGPGWLRAVTGIWAFVLLDLVYLGFRYAAFGDLAGYRDVATGAVVYPLSSGRVAGEALIDLPWALIWPVNLDLIQGGARVVAGVVLAGLLVVLAILAWLERRRPGPARSGHPGHPGHPGRPGPPGEAGEPVGPRLSRLRLGLFGVALGYAMLLPSLPYFYLGRDLLKAYHVYPALVGFGLAGWAWLGSRSGRVPFGLLLVLYLALAHQHAGAWIHATRTVRTFGAWLRDLEPPLDPSGTVWVSGVPDQVGGALVLEASRMQKNLEVLLGRRLGRVEGLGYPWCRVSASEVRASRARGARWIRFDPETGRGVEVSVRSGDDSPLSTRVLVHRGRAVEGTWGPGGAACSGNLEQGWRLRDRASWLEWGGPAVDPVRFAEIEIRLRVTPTGFRTESDARAERGRASARRATTATLRWTRLHRSPHGIRRVVRFPVVADGSWQTCRVDLTRSGWMHEGLPVDSLRLSPARGDVVVNVDRIALISW